MRQANRMSVGSSAARWVAWVCVTCVAIVAAWPGVLAAHTETQPAAVMSDEAFEAAVDLSRIERMSVQHAQALKTFDSWSRITLTGITGSARVDGRRSAYAALDMAMRPELYVERPMLRIGNAALRKDFKELEPGPTLSAAEAKRIYREGTLSLASFNTPEVQHFLERQAGSAQFKQRAVGDLAGAAAGFGMLVLKTPQWPLAEVRPGESGAEAMEGELRQAATLPRLAMIPPPRGADMASKWYTLDELAGNVPAAVAFAKSTGRSVPARVEGYDDARIEEVALIYREMTAAWRVRDAAKVNAAITRLTTALEAINPDAYPSAARRTAEIYYNRAYQLTIPGAAAYFVAFVLFLVSARAGVIRLRMWALRLFAVGFVVHTLGIAIRWWLTEKSVGNWFEAIPIKNMFESVMFAAWFGALVGLVLELRKPRGFFGAAAGFFGSLALIAIFATPYVFGRDIGGEIRHASGVLMSYWLYIHVTMVVASYALIGMSFLIAAWWLVRYYFGGGRSEKPAVVPVAAESAGASGGGSGRGGGAGVLAAPGFLQTLAAVFFLRRAVIDPAEQREAEMLAEADDATESRTVLGKLDLANMVVLQLAFWTLGVGVILGAVWADQSWGRPWGWDPKETFALVTWIVYLMVVHVRLVAKDKAWWTAVLAFVGFFIMLFNWVGVNFFLVGLHSYA